MALEDEGAADEELGAADDEAELAALEELEAAELEELAALEELEAFELDVLDVAVELFELADELLEALEAEQAHPVMAKASAAAIAKATILLSPKNPGWPAAAPTTIFEKPI